MTDKNDKNETCVFCGSEPEEDVSGHLCCPEVGCLMGFWVEPVDWSNRMRQARENVKKEIIGDQIHLEHNQINNNKREQREFEAFCACLRMHNDFKSAVSNAHHAVKYFEENYKDD